MKNNKKRVLIIGAGWEQLELIREIKKMGFYIVATHPFINNEGMSLADVFFQKNSRDIHSHLEIAKTYRVDGIITDNCDYSFHTASIVADALDLPFAPIRSAMYSNDKYTQRLVCQQKQICQPEFYLVEDFKGIEKAAKKIGYPLIVKPVDSRGTFGINIVKEDKKLKSAFIEAIVESPSRRVICEKFIEGTLVTVDGFCFYNGHESLTVASRSFEDGEKPVTKEIVYPAQFEESLKIKLLKNHHQVVESLGYQYGHTHGEYLVDKQQNIFLVECANRGGGVYTSSTIVPELTELNLNKIMLHQSLSMDKFSVKKSQNGHMKNSIILTFFDFEVGKVIKSINTEELKALPYVLKFRTIFKEKDMVESIENCATRHSMLVIKGKNVEEAYCNLNDFKSKINIEYYNL